MNTTTQEGRRTGAETSTQTAPAAFNHKTKKEALLVELSRLNALVSQLQSKNGELNSSVQRLGIDVRRKEFEVEELKHANEAYAKALELSKTETKLAQARAEGDRNGFTTAIQIFASNGQRGAQLQRGPRHSSEDGFAEHLRATAARIGADPDELLSVAERLGMV